MMGGLVDFHSHTVPHADHGCDSVSTALLQLKRAKAAGVKTVIATPHFYPHRHTVDAFLSRRERGCAQLLPHIDGIGYRLGAEVQLCIGLDRMAGIDRLCIEGTDIMLIEMPDLPTVPELYETLERLRRRFSVLIAHVDRYPRSVRNRLAEEGYMLQLNASAFSLHRIGTALDLLATDRVYALGSDIHLTDRSSYPLLSFASRIAGQRVAARAAGLLGE